MTGDAMNNNEEHNMHCEQAEMLLSQLAFGELDESTEEGKSLKQHVENCAECREKIGDIPPSSPSLALFKNGELVHFVPRHRIEGQEAGSIAQDLTLAFDEYCKRV